jgi:UDP-apiose/xylose synthase
MLDNTNNMKILVLGASGFIGSHLVKGLLDKNKYKITAVDITSEKVKKITGKNFKVINFKRIDISKEKDKLKKIIKNNDLVVNLIAIANPGIYVKDPLRTFKLDFSDNLDIIESCVKYKKRLIHFSTSEVYGKSGATYLKNKKFLFNEEKSNLIVGPINKHRWIYSCSKQLLERVIHAYGIQKDLNYTILRPFNYIGPLIDFLPSEKDGCPRVFSFFIDALMYNKPMYLVNGGEAKRCYTYIKDATEAHIKVIENKYNLCNKQIINVGNINNEISIKELAILMRNIYKNNFNTQKKLPPMISISGEEFYGEGYDDSDRRLPDTRKIKKLTGWEAKCNIQKMLYESMEYYINKNNRDKNSKSQYSKTKNKKIT